VPFKGDKYLSPLIPAMVTTEVAEPEAAWVKPKAARRVFRRDIVRMPQGTGDTVCAVSSILNPDVHTVI
jgi:hypothetical protein